MARIYALGIILMLLFLNIPEANNDLQAKIKFYKPGIEAQITAAGDIAGPALTSIMEDVMSKAQIVIKEDGKVIRILDPKTAGSVDTSDNWSLLHDPSITADQFDAILKEYNSPAAGVGNAVIPYAKQQHIDIAYILYIFIHESTAGTNKNWAGCKNASCTDTTHNIGNIICVAGYACYGRFMDFPNWEEGFKKAIELLAAYRDGGPLYNGKRHKTIEEAIHTWAPSDDGNDPAGYAQSLKTNVTKWRAANKGQFIATSAKPGDKTISSVPKLVQSAGNGVEARFTLSGCLTSTVPNALNPSPDLQEFTVPANSDWSFNEHWKIVNPDGNYCGDIPYGGICDMATRYHLVAKQLGLQTIYQRHSGGLNGVDYDDAVVIWAQINPDTGTGFRGGQDLIIVNNSNKAAHFTARLDGNEFIVTGRFL